MSGQRMEMVSSWDQNYVTGYSFTYIMTLWRVLKEPIDKIPNLLNFTCRYILWFKPRVCGNTIKFMVMTPAVKSKWQYIACNYAHIIRYAGNW